MNISKYYIIVLTASESAYSLFRKALESKSKTSQAQPTSPFLTSASGRFGTVQTPDVARPSFELRPRRTFLVVPVGILRQIQCQGWLVPLHTNLAFGPAVTEECSQMSPFFAFATFTLLAWPIGNRVWPTCLLV